IELLKEQIIEFKPLAVVVSNDDLKEEAFTQFGDLTNVLVGSNNLNYVAANDEIDTLVSSLVGFSGLEPTISAIKKSKTIALANKETLVVAGELITKLAKKYSSDILPIDSEHSAIFQCLVGENEKEIEKILLTASGGPFINTRIEDFKNITLEQALKHPNWNMGNKITIDSATMMNKGLEVIEAKWLFNLDVSQIEVLIHPQSIIHSMVQFLDGSVKAQLGLPDMKLPIQYALTYPKRISNNYQRLDLTMTNELTFSKPDLEKYPCLELSYKALEMGGLASVVLNALNEVAVASYLRREIHFTTIPKIITNGLRELDSNVQEITIEKINKIDTEARNFAKEIIIEFKRF
ncbi:MAG: 1-deoxy-D-xylulose-5-phosphate reductoisomerase, partial [Candidatus Kapaibacterium sp.]